MAASRVSCLLMHMLTSYEVHVTRTVTLRLTGSVYNSHNYRTATNINVIQKTCERVQM